MARGKDPIRAQAGKIGGHRLHATHDSGEIAARARRGFLHRFEVEVDPDCLLHEAERQRRAEQAKKAYMAALALKSALARRSGRKPARV
jgi:hypothetical protein